MKPLQWVKRLFIKKKKEIPIPQRRLEEMFLSRFKREFGRQNSETIKVEIIEPNQSPGLLFSGMLYKNGEKGITHFKSALDIDLTDIETWSCRYFMIGFVKDFYDTVINEQKNS